MVYVQNVRPSRLRFFETFTPPDGVPWKYAFRSMAPRNAHSAGWSVYLQYAFRQMECIRYENDQYSILRKVRSTILRILEICALPDASLLKYAPHQKSCILYMSRNNKSSAWWSIYTIRAPTDVLYYLYTCSQESPSRTGKIEYWRTTNNFRQWGDWHRRKWLFKTIKFWAM